MSDFSFLGFKFSPIILDDRQFLTEFLSRYPQRLTGYTFASLMGWNQLFRYGWALIEPESLLISCHLESDDHRHLLQPIGSMSPDILQNLISHTSELSYPMKIIGVSERFLQENPDLMKSFSFVEDRAYSNYLYNSPDLAQLSGRKFSKKRNLLSQASGLYPWTCSPLNSTNINECFSVIESINKEEHPSIEGMLRRELDALEYTLNHFDDLNQEGILISINGKSAAFSVFETINPTTVAIHFERALRSYKGLYQVINWETSKVIAGQGFQFINREEDLGDAGLRSAKLSYHPIEIIPSYELKYKIPSITSI
jgi:uncharacterized protein